MPAYHTPHLCTALVVALAAALLCVVGIASVSGHRESFVVFDTPSMRSTYAACDVAHDPHAGTLTRAVSGAQTTLTYKHPTPQLNDTNSGMLGNHKAVTNRILELHGLPCPRFVYVNRSHSTENMQRLLDAHGVRYPVVVKPVDGTQGYDVHMNVVSAKQVAELCAAMRKTSPRLIVEEQVTGTNYRVMVLNGKVFDVVRRTRAAVTGDGTRTLQQLIDARNAAQKKRGLFPTHNVSWAYVETQLAAKGARTSGTGAVVVPAGRRVYITDVENFHNGCNVFRVPLGRLPPAKREQFERTNAVLGLRLSGIDYMGDDIETPGSDGGHIIEVNPGPDLQMHVDAVPRDPGLRTAFVEALFADASWSPQNASDETRPTKREPSVAPRGA